MSEMNILNLSLHLVDENKEVAEQKQVDLNESDLKDYVKTIVNKTIENRNTRKFSFNNQGTGIAQNILKATSEDNYSDESNIIANEFLIVKKQTQERITFAKLQRGSLLQININYGKLNYFAIIIIDHNEYLNENTLKKQIGLPFEKQSLKTFLCTYNNLTFDEIVFVYDSVNPFSKYWWQSFLNLKEIHNDKHNTETASTSIVHLLKTELKKTYPLDYFYLHNKTIGYFLNNTDFQYDEMVKNVFADYEPNDNNLNKVDLIKKISELPDKKNFDRRFNTDQDSMKQSIIKNQLFVDDDIVIELKTNINNLKDKIYPLATIEGVKGIFIKSNDGYDKLHNKQ